MKNLLSVSVPPCLNKLRQNLPLLLVRGEGHPVPGIHFPSCDQDGYFLPEQCTVLDKQGNKKCWCVDRHGSKVEGTTECCKYSMLICELWMMQWFYEGQKKVYISRQQTWTRGPLWSWFLQCCVHLLYLSCQLYFAHWPSLKFVVVVLVCSRQYRTSNFMKRTQQSVAI